MSRLVSTTTIALMLLATGFAALAPPATASATLTVCAAGCAHGTIQAAIAAASAGDTILVRPGLYAGPIVVDRSVTLCSASFGASSCAPEADKTVIRGGGIYPVVIDADGVTFRGFTVENPAFDAADQDAGPVDPSLVVVATDADGVSILDNILQAPASAPLPGETRWWTVGVNIGEDADAATVSRNLLRAFPRGSGAGATCPTAPCKVAGILNWGEGAGFEAHDNVIDLSGVGLPAVGILFDDNGVVRVTGNVVTLPGSAPGSGPDSVGIDGGVSTGAVVSGNRIAPGAAEQRFGIYGIYGIFRASTFEANDVRGAQHGLMLRSSSVGANRVAENVFADSNQGVLSYARATSFEDNVYANVARAVVLDRVPGDPAASVDVTLHGERFVNVGSALHLTDTLTGVHVDARRNDWGVYTRDLIETTKVEDATGANTVDVSCYLDSNGVTEVCPVAAIATQRLNAGWPRQIRLSDVSASPRGVAAREWTLPDGTTPTDAVVTRAFAPGTHPISLQVTDGEGFTDTKVLSLVLSNTAPSLTAPATATAHEGVELAVQLAATDAENDVLRYSMSGAPAGATLHAVTGAFRWTPGHADGGASYSVVFAVTDGAATTTSTLALAVSDDPAPPVLSVPASRAVLEGQALRVDVSAIDPDGGIVTLSATGLPSGATFTDHADNTGHLDWTPPVGSAGTYPITITATAPSTLTDAETLLVHVSPRGELSLERLTPASSLASPGEVVRLQARVTNLAPGPDVIALSSTASPGWARATSADPALASGGSAIVDLDVTVPASGGTASATLRACSSAQPSVCRELAWTISTPVQISLVLDRASYGMLERVTGNVTVTWLDGTPIPGIAVAVHERWEMVENLASGTSFTTDPSGRAPFAVGGPVNAPGRHIITASIGATRDEDSYRVRNGL